MDILLLIFFCWRIKNIVKPKGYNAAMWQFCLVICSILAEIGGMMVSFLLGKDLTVMMITGILCAIAVFLIVQQRARALPDKSGTDDWISRLGNDQDYRS